MKSYAHYPSLTEEDDLIKLKDKLHADEYGKVKFLKYSNMTRKWLILIPTRMTIYPATSNVSSVAYYSPVLFLRGIGRRQSSLTGIHRNIYGPVPVWNT